MQSKCCSYDMDDDGFERANSERGEDSSSMDIGVHEKLQQGKDDMQPCWHSGFKDAEGIVVALYRFNWQLESSVVSNLFLI